MAFLVGVAIMGLFDLPDLHRFGLTPGEEAMTLRFGLKAGLLTVLFLSLNGERIQAVKT
jgi:hypothetical protein